MNTSTKSLPVVAGIEINIDEHGRYNLNALHRASGMGEEKGPSKWLRSQAVKELVAAMTDGQNCPSPIFVAKGGLEQGTFATELLAIDYAAWISANFKIRVYEVFQQYKNGTLQQAPLSRLEILEMAIASEKEVLRLQDRVQEQQQLMTTAANEIESMDAYRAVADADGTIALADVIKSMGLQRNNTYAVLRSIGVLQQGKKTIPYQKHVQAGYFKVRVQMISGKNVPSTYVTCTGIDFLYRKLEEAKRVQRPIDIEMLLDRLRDATDNNPKKDD